MENLSIKATIRELSKIELAKGRENGQVPAVVYGRDFENKHLVIDQKLFSKIYKEAGESTLVDLVIDDQEPIKVIIQDRQLDPLTSKVRHIDFFKVDMKQAIQTEIELEFIGEAPAIKELGGILVRSKTAIEVKCLPENLVKEIKVDISALKTFDEIIRIKDLDIPENIEVLDDENLTITLVTAPRTDAEMDDLNKKVEADVDNIEVSTAKAEEDGGEGTGEEKKEGESSDESKKKEDSSEKKENKK